jgi:hypothetical protein
MRTPVARLRGVGRLRLTHTHFAVIARLDRAIQ